MLRCIIFLWVLPGTSIAGSILYSSVQLEDGQYTLSMAVRIDAPLALVYDSITDFNNLAAINPAIEESQILGRPAARTQRVRTVTRVCILVFCKRVEQVQDMTLLQEYALEAVILPDMSDFRSGHARWDFKSRDVTTEMHFSARFEPDFWVPPVIGTWLIKRHLVSETEAMAMYIELKVDEQEHNKE